jgi:recombination associated protein RdgC
MFFKNLQFYRLSTEWPITAEKLAEQLSRKLFQPCGNQDTESRGWVPPVGADLVHSVAGQWLICLQTETKVLPAAVVKQEADRRAEAIVAQQGYKPGSKQMKDIREQVIQEFLPRAFTRSKKVFAWIDPVNGWLGIDAPSLARAEDVLESLRQALDSLPLSLLRTERTPSGAMADWLSSGEAPDGFSIDDDTELCSVSEDGAKVRYMRHPLEGNDVREHLEAGKMPTRLALTFDDRISFVLTDKLEIKRLNFLDVVREQLSDDHDDAQSLFDAEFTLMTGEFKRLLPAVSDALGGEIKREPDLIDAVKEAA